MVHEADLDPVRRSARRQLRLRHAEACSVQSREVRDSSYGAIGTYDGESFSFFLQVMQACVKSFAKGDSVGTGYPTRSRVGPLRLGNAD